MQRIRQNRKEPAMHRDIVEHDLSALAGAFELALAPILDEDLDLIAGNRDAPAMEPRAAADPFSDWDGWRPT